MLILALKRFRYCGDYGIPPHNSCIILSGRVCIDYRDER